MTSVDIQLLGGSKFYLGDTAEHSFPTKKSQALLIYLAVHNGNRFSREALCDLLWSRSQPEQARGSLRQALSQIRRTLKETPLAHALTDQNGLACTLDKEGVDVARFEQLCKADDTASWQAASDLYQDEFLAGFSINEAAFENWATSQRSYYYDLALKTQKKLIAAQLKAGTMDEAIAASRRLLVLDEFDEWGVMTLMQIYALLNRRADAIKLYQTYSGKLLEELDASPGAEAEKLFEEIRAGAKVDAIATPEAIRAEPAVKATPDYRPVIGVLPFEDTSPVRNEAWLTDGLTEDIIIGLSRSSIMQVLDRNQTFGSRALAQNTPATISQDADYILKGSVSIENNRIRVGAGLTQSKTNRVCWARRYERPYTDLFSVHRDIISAIVSILEPVVMEDQQKIALSMKEDSLEHWHLLMKGRWHFWRMSRKENNAAQELLGRAILLKPNDVTTLFSLAFTHMAQAWVYCDVDTEKSVNIAFAHAEAALKADPNDPWAHLAMGTAHSCRGDVQRAIAELKLALELNPHFAAARGELGRMYALTGTQSDKTFEFAQQALEESPADPHANLWKMSIGLAHFVLGNQEEAMAAAIEAVAHRPFWFQNHFLLCVCEYEAGNKAAARKALKDGLRLSPNYTLAAFKAGHPFQRAADMDRFLSILKDSGWEY